MVAIRFENLFKSFGDNHVLRGVSLDVEPGQVHFIIGHSGAGKSVLIKQLVGLLRPDAGHIWFDGADVARMNERELVAVRRRCQLIFQGATLFDALPVWENLALPLRKRFGVSRAEARRLALESLAKVHAEHLAARFPPELGAGVKKRVAIARAIALRPEALLYDEPTTSLDPVAARRTDRLIREMADRGAAGVGEAGRALTTLVVSHDLRSVRDIGDRVTFLLDGRIRFDGPPAALFAAVDPEVAGFVRGSTARWDAGARLEAGSPG